MSMSIARVMKVPAPNADRDAARFWDRHAARYAAAAIKDSAGYERTIARTIELIRGFTRVQELGCGTGMTALRLSPHVGWIEASDVSMAMIDIARTRARDAQISNVIFEAAPADRSDTGERPVDAILAFNLMHLIRDRAPVLASAYRRLRPGGLLITKTPCLAEMNPLIRMAVPAMRLVGLAPPVAFFRSIDLERELGKAGFAVEERARHGSSQRDARIFIVAQKPAAGWET